MEVNMGFNVEVSVDIVDEEGNVEREWGLLPTIPGAPVPAVDDNIVIEEHMADEQRFKVVDRDYKFSKGYVGYGTEEKDRFYINLKVKRVK